LNSIKHLNDSVDPLRIANSYLIRDGHRASGKGPLLDRIVDSLGNATKLRTPPNSKGLGLDFNFSSETGEILSSGKLNSKESINNARKIRFDLQDSARKILYSFYPDGAPVNKKGFEVHHRTCSCSLFRTGSTTQVVKSKTHGKAFYSGLMNCANSRTCPVCSVKISERKANEMRTAFNIAKAEKLNISLLTFTAPHNASDSLDNLKDGITKALEQFWRGASAKRFKQKYGVIGHVRSFEIRYGSNGWHPHFHIILFSEKQLPFTFRSKGSFLSGFQTEEWEKILYRWRSCCLRSGLNAPNEYGMDIQSGALASEYISKFGSDDEILKTKKGKDITWDMADEMTKGNIKTGRTGSSSPWDLLSLSSDGATDEIKKKARLLFLEYARSMKGVNLIRWSRGLRDYFSLGKQDSDKDIIAQEEDKADLLCHIKPHEWEYIIKNKLRSIGLELAENGGSEAIARLLYVGNEFESFEDYFYEFNERNSLIDHEVLKGDFDTVPNKVSKDISITKVIPEHQNYLSTISVDIFDKINKDIEKSKKLEVFKFENYDLFSFAEKLRNDISEAKK